MPDLARVVSDARRSSPAAPAGPGVSWKVARGERDLSIQSVVGGAGSLLNDIHQQLNIHLADRDYFFGMILFDSAGQRVSADRALRPGETYKVQISVELSRYVPPQILPEILPLTQQPLRIDREVQLFLFAGDLQPELRESAPASSKALTDWSAEAQFRVPPDFSRPRIFVELLFGVLHSRVAALEYAVEATAPPAPQGIPRAAYVPANPPARTALLHVDSDGEQIRFTLFYRDRESRPQMFGPVARPTPPADAGKEAAYLESIRKQVQDLAVSYSADLSERLKDFVEVHGRDGCVVIVDRADSQIPWEMFAVKPDLYLGEVAAVVRWTEALYRNRPVEFQTAPQSLAGRLAAYIDKRDWNDACPCLKALNPAPADDLDDLEDSLLRPGAPPVALVYLNSGGLLLYGDEGAAIAAPPAIAARDRLELNYTDLDDRFDPPPLFFIDAAWSGRILGSVGQFRGLAQATLSRVATAYIGTLGPVPRTIAALVAQRFLTAAAGGVNPALLLREIRADAAARMRDFSLPKAQRLQSVYAFLYVYYGSPLLQVTV